MTTEREALINLVRTLQHVDGLEEQILSGFTDAKNAIDANLQVGDTVRSFDFPMTLDDGRQSGHDLTGENANYIVGVIDKIDMLPANMPQDCPRYHILVCHTVRRGRRFFNPDADGRIGKKVYPPVNGTPTTSGMAADGVEYAF